MQVKTTDYDTIQTGVYAGKHQAVVGWVNKDGEFKPRAHKVVKKDGTESFPPISITIGDKETATNFLLDWLKEITGEEYSEVKF